MNKKQIRDDYVSKGWTIQPVADWNKVSEVDGVVKYDINVVDPDDNFRTVQVKVTGDEQANEDVKPLGALKPSEPDFEQEARTWIRDKEESIPTVFAIAVGKVLPRDEVIEVTAYNTDNTEQKYVVKRRGGAFSFQKTN